MLIRIRFESCICLFVLAILTQILCQRREVNGQSKTETGWSERAEKALAEGKGDEALQIIDQVIASSPNASSLRLIRGMVCFRLGRITDSLQDFDKSIEMNPVSKPECWQRGISLYYLDKFEAGREQFEVHRTVNPNDVENAFWHFLCVAKKDGVEAARAALLPCGRDSRVPLMEVLELLKGNSTPEAVITAAESTAGGPRGKSVAKFYGHLYVGLYYDALGKKDLAKAHLEKSIAEKTGEYMRDVALIHLQKLDGKL
jgi:lipoprotein NlpI